MTKDKYVIHGTAPNFWRHQKVLFCTYQKIHQKLSIVVGTKHMMGPKGSKSETCILTMNFSYLIPFGSFIVTYTIESF